MFTITSLMLLQIMLLVIIGVLTITTYGLMIAFFIERHKNNKQCKNDNDWLK
jgi:hypothetical protein